MNNKDFKFQKYSLKLSLNTDILKALLFQSQNVVSFQIEQVNHVEQQGKNLTLNICLIKILQEKFIEFHKENIRYIHIKFNDQIKLNIQKDKNKSYLVLEILEQINILGCIDEELSQITLQINYNPFQEYQYSIEFYENETFKGETKIKNRIPFIYMISQGLINGEQFFYFESLNIILLQNFKVSQSPYQNLQSSRCLLKATPIHQKIKDSDICIYYQISNKQQDILELNVERNNIQRILVSIQYIHGSNMKSIIRNMYSDSQLKQTINSVQSINTFMVIGYFKLSQLVSGKQYLPLITIGVQSEFYNILNLLVIGSSILQMKYINNSSNEIKTQLQILSSMLNTWIGAGVVYFRTNSMVKLVYTDTNFKLISGTTINSATFPSTIQYFDVCITCKIDGGIFEHFIGAVSTVKIIYEVDFSNTDKYYFYNEITQIRKTSILNASFNINTYTQNSEYDFGKGFTCNSGYAFFEGVCIDKNNCKTLMQVLDVYSSFESGKIYDSSQNKCLNCSSNCLECSSISVCISCRLSYKLVNGICIKCSDSNQCNSSCLGSQTFDPMNQMCVDTFIIQIQQLSHLLLSSRIITDNSDVIVENDPPFSSINDQVVHCYIDVDNSPSTLYSFLGGTKFTISTIIKRSFTSIPKGYQKSVTFYALFYGSGDPSKLQVKINTKSASLDNSYLVGAQNKISCSGSGTQTQSLFKVTFIILDYQNTFDLEIQSASSMWGIRNINFEVSKCHPTCDSCKLGGSADDCTSCNSSLTINKFQCTCKYGQYAKYKTDCFDSTCIICVDCSILNCQKCEDITGNCTQCNSGYSINDGQCIQSNLCNNNDKLYFNHCGVLKELGFTHFKSDQIAQYADYWKFNGGVFGQQCLTQKCTPLLGQGMKHSLKISLPNYFSYHYQLNIMIQIYAYKSIESADYISIYDNSVQEFTHCYFTEKQALPNPPNNEGLFNPDFTYLKTNDILSLEKHIKQHMSADFSSQKKNCNYLSLYHQFRHPLVEFSIKNWIIEIFKMILLVLVFVLLFFVIFKNIITKNIEKQIQFRSNKYQYLMISLPTVFTIIQMQIEIGEKQINH